MSVGKPSVLAVDDEPGVRSLLKAMLGRKGYACETADSALRMLKDKDYDLLVTDLRMPGLPGEALVQRLRKERPGLPVIVISAHGGTKSVVEVIKHGAEDYLPKPFSEADLELVVFKALEKRRLLKENERLRRELSGGDLEGLTGKSAAMRRVFTLIDKLAPSPLPCLISGESGTGKELAARALHLRSLRAKGPFITLNAGALPATLFEGELFGAKRGAYTGSEQDREGLFEAADGGTLFLDEVGEVPLESQAKLLRVLESGELKRLGESKARKVDVRVVAASNRDLEAMVEKGGFRRDLYFRLAVLPLRLPPLRERLEDVPLLAQALLERAGAAQRALSPAALKRLMSHPWPGNVRELKNVLERALLLAEGDTIESGDLVFTAGAQELPLAAGPFKQAKRRMVADFEKAFLREALKAAGGNISKAADSAGLARQNFQALMKKHALKKSGA